MCLCFSLLFHFLFPYFVPTLSLSLYRLTIANVERTPKKKRMRTKMYHPGDFIFLLQLPSLLSSALSFSSNFSSTHLSLPILLFHHVDSVHLFLRSKPVPHDLCIKMLLILILHFYSLKTLSLSLYLYLFIQL